MVMTMMVGGAPQRTCCVFVPSGVCVGGESRVWTRIVELLDAVPDICFLGLPVMCIRDRYCIRDAFRAVEDGRFGLCSLAVGSLAAGRMGKRDSNLAPTLAANQQALGSTQFLERLGQGLLQNLLGGLMSQAGSSCCWCCCVSRNGLWMGTGTGQDRGSDINKRR